MHICPTDDTKLCLLVLTEYLETPFRPFAAIRSSLLAYSVVLTYFPTAERIFVSKKAGGMRVTPLSASFPARCHFLLIQQSGQ